MVAASGLTIFLTGTTGFLGKVVLEELLRRSEEYSLAKIIVLLRPSKYGDAETRFSKQVASSPCFEHLTIEWRHLVHVVEGDLTDEYCGLNLPTRRQILPQITHIINCAACVAFDLPLADAAKANVGSILNLLQLAKACTNLQNIVTTSTSYVAPHSEGRIYPRVASLPYPAMTMYQDILANRADEKKLLRQTGYPNTYTLTKCIAEHIYLSFESSLPLCIVRPSIISCAWRYPAPGWIDSKAAVAGYIALMGAGYLRVVDGQRDTVLDVVPVDVVANDIIDQARLIPVSMFDWSDNSSEETLIPKHEHSIVHSVSGLRNGLSNGMLTSTAVTYFQTLETTAAGRKHLRRPEVVYLGKRNLSFHFHDIKSHRLPLYLSSLYLDMIQNKNLADKTRILSQVLKKINKIFPYYTHRTFDFEPGKASSVLNPTLGNSTQHQKEFTPQRYAEVICHGVKEYLLKI